jgi:hypothetical protein
VSDARADIEAALIRLSRDDGVAPNTHDLACALRALLLEAKARRAPVEAQPQGDAARLTPAQQRAAYLEGMGAYGVKERPSDARDQPSPRPGGAQVMPAAQEAARAAGLFDLADALAARAHLGEARYGRPLETRNGRDVLRDLEEEVVDAYAYATQAVMEGYARARSARAALAEVWRAMRGLRPEGLNAPSPDRLT